MDENLKSHHKQLWKYVSQFNKTNTDFIHLEMNGILINLPHAFTEAFSKYFQPVYSSSCPRTFPFINQSTEALSLTPVSNSEVP
jgi:hypothetical protein